MTRGQDWTAEWRDAGVAEYVLIGDLAEGAKQQEYSMRREHLGYERRVLEDVSAEMLTVYDAKERTAHPGLGSSCAVAYRRRATPRHP
eukprot:3843032-Prymnesium_polylepis.1